MNLHPYWNRWFASAVVLLAGALRAKPQLEILPGNPQNVFGGGARAVQVLLSNRGNETVSLPVNTALVQASSGSAIRLGTSAWKQLVLQPQQTVRDIASLTFPAVRAQTRFLVQWFNDTNKVFGTTEVWVYPTNLLVELKPLAGESPLGAFDPADELKPLLQEQAVEFQNLFEDGTDKFRGKLAIFGPFTSRQQMRGSLAGDIRALAKRGVAVVWLQPPPAQRAPLRPSFYTVRLGAGSVVVAQASLVARLPESPEAQLNLLRLVELALTREHMICRKVKPHTDLAP